MQCSVSAARCVQARKNSQHVVAVWRYAEEDVVAVLYVWRYAEGDAVAVLYVWRYAEGVAAMLNSSRFQCATGLGAPPAAPLALAAPVPRGAPPTTAAQTTAAQQPL